MEKMSGSRPVLVALTPACLAVLVGSVFSYDYSAVTAGVRSFPGEGGKCL